MLILCSVVIFLDIDLLVPPFKSFEGEGSVSIFCFSFIVVLILLGLLLAALIAKLITCKKSSSWTKKDPDGKKNVTFRCDGRTDGQVGNFVSTYVTRVLCIWSC